MTEFKWFQPDQAELTEAAPEGNWPWVGDQFLAAFHIIQRGDEKCDTWEYAVLMLDERGSLSYANGEPFDDWSYSDIEWIGKIPRPEAV